MSVWRSAAASPRRCASTSGMKTRRFLLQCSGRRAETIRNASDYRMRAVTTADSGQRTADSGPAGAVRLPLSAVRWSVVVIWIALMIRLMIADVWDETNGMLAFCDPARTLGFKVHFVLTQSLGFWRPLPALIAAVLLHFVRDFDVNWRILRGIDIAM